MSPQSRLVTLSDWSCSVIYMTTKNDVDTAESADISKPLQELSKSLGVSQAELARRVGIDRRTFNPYFTGARSAGLPTIRKIAQATGRTVAWLLGEEVGRAVIGTCDARGRVSMSSPVSSPSIVKFIEASGAFPAGVDVFVDPTETYAAKQYMLVKTRGSEECWFAWGRSQGELLLLDRLDGELHVYNSTRYEILGVIVGMVVAPPVPLSE